jgi:hypothetical protein
MALDKHALSDLLDALRAGGDIDVIRAGMQLVAQALIELEATQQIGAPLRAKPRSPHPSKRRPRAAALCRDGARNAAGDGRQGARALLVAGGRAVPGLPPGLPSRKASTSAARPARARPPSA